MVEDDLPESDDLTAEIEAIAIWEHHLKEAADSWREGVSQSVEQYREGLADALGVEPEDVPDDAVENWQERVMETESDEFAAAITGEGVDWFVELYESSTGDEPPTEVTELARAIEREALTDVGDDPTEEEIADAVRNAVRRHRADATDGN